MRFWNLQPKKKGAWKQLWVNKKLTRCFRYENKTQMSGENKYCLIPIKMFWGPAKSPFSFLHDPSGGRWTQQLASESSRWSAAAGGISTSRNDPESRRRKAWGQAKRTFTLTELSGVYPHLDRIHDSISEDGHLACDGLHALLELCNIGTRGQHAV